MKIVFIQPKSFHTWEALNLGYIASYLKKHGLNNLEFYSSFFDSDEKIIDECKNADIIGFSCTSPHMKSAIKLAESIKSENQKCWIVFGGVHPSALPQETIKHNCIDQVVVGEGEIAMFSIVMGNREPILRSVPVKDINRLPFPDRHFIKQERNISQAYKENGIRIGSIFSSRGCPFFCTFCASHSVWGRKVRFRSAQNILDEFKTIVHELNLDFIKFSDDTFTLNRKLVNDFCEIKISQKIKTPWACNVRVDTVDRALLKKMWKAGCREVWVGVESGSEKILADMRKKIKINRVRNVFAWTKEIGFFRRAYILLGMPNENWEDIELTDKLVEEISPDSVGFTILAPYPGTEYYDSDKYENVDWSQVDEYENDFWRTKHLTNNDLRYAQKKLAEKYQNKLVYRLKEIYKSFY